jgi:hypothetical protein
MIYRLCSDVQTRTIQFVQVTQEKQLIGPAYVFASQAHKQYHDDYKPVTFS